MFPMLAMSFIMNVIMVAWIGVCVILGLVILIQKGKGGGLSGAFGGAGSGAGLLGTKTGDFLTWVTISLVGLFFLLAIIMGIFLTSGDAVPAAGTVGTPAGQSTPAAPAGDSGEALPVPADGAGEEPAGAGTPAPGGNGEATGTGAGGEADGNADNTETN